MCEEELNFGEGVPDWGTYFLDIADKVAQRASCSRAKVGCVIVNDNRILSTGYNGAPQHRENCFQKGYCYREKHNIASGTKLELCYASGAHAELNAVVNAARFGVAIDNAEMYIVGHDFVCAMCQSVILNANISKVVLRNRKGIKTIFLPKRDFTLHPLLDV